MSERFDLGLISTRPKRELIHEIDVALLTPGKYQPRANFNNDTLTELADSIRENGIIQPIIVRKIKVTEGEEFEIVAGERRWRAAKMAGLTKIPIIIRVISDKQAIAAALIENLQRDDLNAIEQSRALIRLQTEFQLTQKQVAETVGKSRASVANFIRLSALQPPVKAQLESGDIDLGHAKCLLGLQDAEEQIAAGQQIAQLGLTVRETEQLVKRVLNGSSKSSRDKSVSVNHTDLEEAISKAVDLKVKISSKGEGGTLSLKFECLSDLERIAEMLTRQ
ncbi:ParB/RepB/Spo0J family partition protein [Porticoccaceae bacterium]|nr:ParB/RepB/Spo0J family partition protein [Porticoccaceae bacterium]MDA8652376.1 ParB/RepB/Spo0J family partition protein [Porticoccaceae bacterium]MDA8663485.1 ParB/RepB/Spo0J family partition protein [Porticoccaceae bacterium]MDB2343159.1 ParB/RepB/Spo0J family partition protein [Porticoccaceae bacterium]MDB2665052.1 ParB/RepB/Spo0J family partition protein [Porticoccaceae bacterium]